MGMHHGLIVFRGTIASLEKVVAQRNGSLTRFGPSVSLSDLPESSDDGFPCAFRAEGETTVFLDQSMVLTSDPDVATLLAAQTGSMAVTCLAETVSGTFEFALADSSGLKRAYSHCHMSQVEPWSFGTPLKCEALHPFNDDLDGNGFFAAFAELGFGEVSRLYDQQWTPCLLDFDFEAPAPAKSAMACERDAFAEAHKLAAPAPLVVVARPPAVIAPSIGTPATPKQASFQWLRRLFRRV